MVHSQLAALITQFWPTTHAGKAVKVQKKLSLKPSIEFAIINIRETTDSETTHDTSAHFLPIKPLSFRWICHAKAGGPRKATA